MIETFNVAVTKYNICLCDYRKQNQKNINFYMDKENTICQNNIP